MTIPAEYQDRFAKLRLQFLSGLPKREAELEDLTAILLTSGPCHQTLEKLHIATHKLAGICATYGLMDVGRHAAEVENMIEGLDGRRITETMLYDVLLGTELLSDALRQAYDSAT